MWTAISKLNIHLHGSCLFSNKKASTKKIKGGTMLVKKCGPLAVEQCTGEWFLLIRFHFTGTLGADARSIGANASSNFSDETKTPISALFETCFPSWFGHHKSPKYMKK